MSWPTLRGHETTWQHLVRLLGDERLPHALLFTGPPGIGKARLALRLAARLSCTATPETRPCGECAGCRQVAAGSHPDLLSLGAPERGKKEARKKEIGIEQARELKRFAQLRSVVAPRKMAIVDDADRLSVAAQNALLKTLEEPPGQALIILITAAPGALLPTVRSRCQRILCRPLADAELRAALADAGVPADRAAALSAVAEGSPGRALALHEAWQDADQLALEGLLAELEGGRYVSVLAMSKGLGSGELEMTSRLDSLLRLCRDAALRAAAEGNPDALDRAVRRAQAVVEALRDLRWSNAHRGLLSEALALRLART